MKLKIFIFINLLITISLFVSSYYFITWREALYDEFFKVGWENYDNVSIRTPARYFSKLLIGGSFFTLGISIQIFRKEKIKKTAILLIVVAVLSLFLGLIMLGGGINVTLKVSWSWRYLFTLNIILSVYALLKSFESFEKNTLRNIPPALHDILDDPNSITHQETENES